MRLGSTLLLVTGALSASVVSAHHSYAMFDETKVVTLTGTVKELQWTNPHVWLQVSVPTDGGFQEWGIEGGPPTILRRKGLDKTSLPAGTAVVVKAHPLKSGKPGGSLMSIAKPDGTVIFADSFGEYKPPDKPPAQ